MVLYKAEEDKGKDWKEPHGNGKLVKIAELSTEEREVYCVEGIFNYI